jgi:hypothetical protein
MIKFLVLMGSLLSATYGADAPSGVVPQREDGGGGVAPRVTKPVKKIGESRVKKPTINSTPKPKSKLVPKKQPQEKPVALEGEGEQESEVIKQPSQRAPKPRVRAKSTDCPQNCVEAGEVLREIYKTRLQIEKEHKAKDPDYQGKKINPVNKKFDGTCADSCKNLIGMEKQLANYKKELADLKSQPEEESEEQPEDPEKHDTSSPKKSVKSKVTGSLKKGGRNLEKTLFSKSSQSKHQGDTDLNPGDQSQSEDTTEETEEEEDTIKPVSKSLKSPKKSLTPSPKKSQNSLSKSEDQPEDEVEEPSSVHSQGLRAQPKGPCPNNCLNFGKRLEALYKLRVEIEGLRQTQNPTYEKKAIPKVDLDNFEGTCASSCHHIVKADEELKKDTKLVKDLKASIQKRNQAKKQAKDREKVQKIVPDGCSAYCDNEVDLMIQIRQLTITLDELKHQQNPSYQVKHLKPIDPNLKIGKKCSKTCEKVKLLTTHKKKLKGQIAELKETIKQAGQGKQVKQSQDEEEDDYTQFAGGSSVTTVESDEAPPVSEMLSSTSFRAPVQKKTSRNTRSERNHQGNKSNNTNDSNQPEEAGITSSIKNLVGGLF